MDGVSVRLEKHDVIYLNVVKGEFNNDNSTTKIPLFWKKYKTTGYDKKVPARVGVAYTDQIGAEWFYGVGDECDMKSTTEAPFERIIIPAQRWAIFSCRDSGTHAITVAYNYAFGEWFIKSGEEIMPGYNIEKFIEGDMDSENALCELWLPIA